MKARGRQGSRRSLNLLACLLKCTAPGSVTKSQKLWEGWWGIWGCWEACLQLLVRSALAFLPPAVLTPFSGDLIVPAAAASGFVISRMKHSFLLSLAFPPSLLWAWTPLFRGCMGQTTGTPCDVIFLFAVLPMPFHCFSPSLVLGGRKSPPPEFLHVVF
jgi:hypothetical protein